MRVTADDARRLVCADRPDARGITDRRLRAVARLPCHSAWRVCHTSRTAHDRQRPERVSGVVPDHERLVEVRSQVAIRPYSCRLAGLRHQPAIRSQSSNANHVEEPEAANVSEAPNGSGVPKALAAPTALASADAGDRSQPAASDVFRRLGGVDLTMLWLCAAMVVPWLGWRIVDDYLARRKMASIVVRYFVHRFVDEFERPLVRYDVEERPVRSRLRCGARLRRFDILLAPGEGRRYPNLSDHKKNVEYDVARVMHVLADDSFVSGALYTQAGWIVVPFQFTAGPKQSGVTCISSL